MVEYPLALGLAFPIGYHLALVGVDVFLTDVVGLQGALVERVEVFHRVAGELREGGDGLRPRPALADDEFVGTYVDGLFLTEFIKVPLN
jgi:hypothetical protein